MKWILFLLLTGCVSVPTDYYGRSVVPYAPQYGTYNYENRPRPLDDFRFHRSGRFGFHGR